LAFRYDGKSIGVFRPDNLRSIIGYLGFATSWAGWLAVAQASGCFLSIYSGGVKATGHSAAEALSGGINFDSSLAVPYVPNDPSTRPASISFQAVISY
jgi:hypothetical protein